MYEDQFYKLQPDTAYSVLAPFRIGLEKGLDQKAKLSLEVAAEDNVKSKTPASLDNLMSNHR